MNNAAQGDRAPIKKPATAVLAVAMLVVAGGCASTPDRPAGELATAEAVIAQAQQSGAAEHSPAELAAAQNKLAEAKLAAERDDMVAARRLAEQAALDAELATAMTRNQQAESAVDELNDTIDALREEIARNQSRAGEMR
ncbi:MAG TPA: DUF4398 domain-containing protein [Woeseiaceae bacterium]